MKLLCSSRIYGHSLYLAFWLATVVFSPVLVTRSHDDTLRNLLTGLSVGEVSSVRDSLSLHFLIAMLISSPLLHKTTQKIAITGTVQNPCKYELRFEAIRALLSLFELQEKIHNQLNSTPEGSGMLDEDYSSLTSVEILLNNVIQDSCNYVSGANHALRE